MGGVAARYALAAAALAWGAGARLGRARLPRLLPLRRSARRRRCSALGSLLLSDALGAAARARSTPGSRSGSRRGAAHGDVRRHGIPDAQDHLELFPARLVAIVANSLGTLAVVWVAVATIRRRPLGNALILAGLAVAAAGSALSGLGATATAVWFALAVCLFYLGFTAGPGWGRRGVVNPDLEVEVRPGRVPRRPHASDSLAGPDALADVDARAERCAYSVRTPPAWATTTSSP